MKRIVLVVCVVLQVSALHARPAAAQSRFNVTPYLGMYIPMGRLVSNNGITMRQMGSAVAGTALQYELSHHVGVEASLGYVASYIARSNAVETNDLASGVLLSSIRTRFRLTPVNATGDYTFWIAPGVGMISRMGAAWTGINGASSAAIVLSGGVRVRPRGTPISYGIQFDDYASRIHYRDGAGATLTNTLHNDLVYSFSAMVPVGHARLPQPRPSVAVTHEQAVTH